MAPAAPSPALRRPRPSSAGGLARSRRSRVTARAALLLVIVLVTGAFSMAPLHAYLQERSNIAELERQAQILGQANADLQARVGTLHDPNELERIARECLGMVKPGETAFVMVPAGGGKPSSDC